MNPPSDKLRSAAGPFRRRESGAAQWWIREGWEDQLLGPAAPDWFALERDPRAARVKPGRLRMTWRVALAGDVVYAKVAEHRRLVDRIKRLGAGSSAEREYRACQEAERRAVPVARCLAVGSLRGQAPMTVLLSEELAGAVALSEAWRRDVTGVDRRARRKAASEYVETAAELFASAHERGFLHGDAHPSNILAARDRDGRLTLTFIDLKAARFRAGPVSRRGSVASLVQLDQYFHRRATRAQRLRFLLAYLRARPSLSGATTGRAFESALAGDLARVRAAHDARLVRQRDRRLSRRGRCFTTLSLRGGWTATVALRLERRHLFPEPDVPDRTRKEWRAMLRSALPVIRETVGDQDFVLYLDGVRCDAARLNGLGARVAAAVLGSAPRRAFGRCHRARHRDVENELILGFAEHRSAGLIDTTLLFRPAGRLVESDHRYRRARSEGDRHVQCSAD